MGEIDDWNTTLLMTSVYKLADKLIMPQLKNYLLDSLRKLWLEEEVYMPLEDIEKHCQTCVAGDKLYDFVLKQFVWVLNIWTESADLESNVEGIFANAALMKDLLLTVREYNLNRWEDPRSVVGCHWHDHTDGSKCEDVVAPDNATATPHENNA